MGLNFVLHYSFRISICQRQSLSSDAEVASDNPFFAFRDFGPLMQQAVLTTVAELVLACQSHSGVTSCVEIWS